MTRNGSSGPSVALVTGGTRGIGLAIADSLAQSGHTVVLNYRSNIESARAAVDQVKRHGGVVDLIQADMSDATQVDQMIRHVRSTHGSLDRFVSNAGITADGFAVMMSQDKWDRVIDTNLCGAFQGLRAAARTMASRRRGALLAVASTSAINAPSGQANYAASKAGLVAAMRVMAKELGGYGVRINAILPGFIETDMTRAVPPERIAQHLEHLPLGRLGRPDEVAAAAAFLLSDSASYITGSTLTIDGGLTC